MTMTDDEFMRLVDVGIDSLSAEKQRWLKNVAIVVEDAPSIETQEGMGVAEDEVIFGLYEGVPQSERGVVDGVLLPDKITIFKEPILKAYSDPDDIAACIANTVWHEVAHHLGYDEEWIEEEEKRRGKLL